MTRIGIIGAGHVGANLAHFFTHAGHAVSVSFSTDQAKLRDLAAQTGAAATTPQQAVESSEVVILSVPWLVVDESIAAAGGAPALRGKVVIDTTNQFGPIGDRFGVLDLGTRSAAEVNAAKAPEARWAKAFNTLTAAFQRQASGRTGPDRVVMFYAAGDDSTADTVATLIDDAGFEAVRTGTLRRTDVGHQEPKGELYGEEFHRGEALAAVTRLRGTTPANHGRP